MRETINRMWASFREWFSKVPTRTRIRLGILALAVIVLAIIVVALMTRTRWVELPGATDSANQAAIYQVLNELGIPTRTSDNVIEVPEERLQEAQAELRARNVMSASAFDDYYLSQAAGFGVSSEHARQLYDLQLADNIRTQLLQIPRVQNALVTVRSGENSPFRIQTNVRNATASIQLTLDNENPLSESDAQAIADLVRGSVPGIEYEDIIITDTMMRSYRPGDESQNMQVELDQRFMYQNMLAEQWKMLIEQLLTPIYGPDNIQVQPYVVLDFDTRSQTIVEFEPPIPGSEEGIVRSSEEIYERSRRWANAEGIPGTDTNAMGTAEYPYGDFGEDDFYLRDVRSLNYEINETRTAIEVARGRVEYASITVLLNTHYIKADEDAEEEYVEGPDLSAEVRDMVAGATGISPGNISVQNIEFTYYDETLDLMLAAQEERERQERMDRLIDQILMYGTILALGIMVALLVRSVVNALRPPPEPEMILAADGPMMSGLDFIIGDEDIEIEAEEEEEVKEYEDVDFDTKSAGLEQIEKFIDKDAEAVAQLLRNWLSDE